MYHVAFFCNEKKKNHPKQLQSTCSSDQTEVCKTNDSSLFFFRKGRRKDNSKDSPTPPVPEEARQYLEDSCVRERVTDADFYKLVALPPSVDYNEWLATHCK